MLKRLKTANWLVPENEGTRCPLLRAEASKNPIAAFICHLRLVYKQLHSLVMPSWKLRSHSLVYLLDHPYTARKLHSHWDHRTGAAPTFCRHSEILFLWWRFNPPLKSLCTFATLARKNAKCAFHRSFTFCRLQRSGSNCLLPASFDRAKRTLTSREMDLDGPETSTHCRWSRAITSETCFWFA